MKFESLMAMAVVTTTVLSTACSGAPLKGTAQTDQAAGKLYVYESDAGGFNTKNYFYDNGEEVVVFDTQFTPEIAEKSIAFLRTQTSNPIRYVVITHPNPDKFNGMSVFQRLGAQVIASSRTAGSMKEVDAYKRYYFVNVAKMFTGESYPKLSQVDITFDETYDLKLRNGEVISLKELANPGVSSNQTVALIPSIHSVIVGDLVHHGVHAWLEGGIVNGKPTPTLQGWIADLNKLQSMFKDAPQTTVYGGRGEAAPIDEAVTDQISYLNRADQIVTDYVQGLGDRKSELLGPQAGEHYQKLQAIFEKEFPTHGLGYMIQYGVYGLVNSKL